ncbi:MAG: hypothetical protein K0V04_10155, partial [Deltaproteobacteria bacterium]|nr:hypothetical protein [Deltaproteobacteria bacterium]
TEPDADAEPQPVVGQETEPEPTPRQLEHAAFVAELEKLRPAADAKLRRVYETLRTQGMAPKDWPKTCAGLGGNDVLLLSYVSIYEKIFGDASTLALYTAEAHTGPHFLRNLTGRHNPYDRDQTRKHYTTLGEAPYVGVLRLSKYDSPDAELVGAKAAAGRIEGWLYVVDGTSGAPVCTVSARATNSAAIETRKLALTAVADDLAGNFVRTLSERLDEEGGVLVDETGPVTKSARYTTEAIDPANKGSR